MVLLATRLTRVRRTRIWIADSQRADYDCLTSGTNAGQLEVCFLASARDVLHRWSADSPDVCIVNVQLPGLSGFDLVEMLRPFPTGMTVCMVDDQYLPENEVRALSLGVHYYFCKPLEGAVLSEFCARRKPERRCCG
jgi:DNA-binding response OmpR family regulator